MSEKEIEVDKYERKKRMELEAHIEEKKHSFERKIKSIPKNKKKNKISVLNYENYDGDEE